MISTALALFISLFSLNAFAQWPAPQEAPEVEATCAMDPIPWPPGSPVPPPTAAHIERAQLLAEAKAGTGPLLTLFAALVSDLPFVDKAALTPGAVGAALLTLNSGRFACSAFAVQNDETQKEQSALPKLKNAVAAYFLKAIYDADISPLKSQELIMAFVERVERQERPGWTRAFGPDFYIGLGVVESKTTVGPIRVGIVFYVYDQSLADKIYATLGKSIRGLPYEVVVLQGRPRAG